MRKWFICIVFTCINVLAGSSAVAASKNELQRLNEKFNAQIAEQEFIEALETARRFTAFARDKHGPESLAYAAGLNREAAAMQILGRLADMGPKLEAALRIYKKLLKPNDENVAAALNNLALYSHWMKRYDRAIELYRDSLHRRENARPKDSCKIAQSLNNIAYTYLFIERFEDAERLLERADRLVRGKGKEPSCPQILNQILLNTASAQEGQEVVSLG